MKHWFIVCPIDNSCFRSPLLSCHSSQVKINISLTLYNEWLCTAHTDPVMRFPFNAKLCLPSQVQISLASLLLLRICHSAPPVYSWGVLCGKRTKKETFCTDYILLPPARLRFCSVIAQSRKGMANKTNKSCRAPSLEGEETHDKSLYWFMMHG